MLFLLRLNISYFIYAINLESINFEINESAKSTMLRKAWKKIKEKN